MKIKARFIQRTNKVVGTGIWWREMGEASKYPSALNGHCSELAILILVAFCVRFKHFLN